MRKLIALISSEGKSIEQLTKEAQDAYSNYRKVEAATNPKKEKPKAKK